MDKRLKVALVVTIGIVVVIVAMVMSCYIVQIFPEPGNPEWAESQKSLLSFVCAFNNLAGLVSGPSAVGIADASCIA